MFEKNVVFNIFKIDIYRLLKCGQSSYRNYNNHIVFMMGNVNIIIVYYNKSMSTQ